MRLILQNYTINSIDKMGGPQKFIAAMEHHKMNKKHCDKFIFDVFIIYIDFIYMGVDMKIEAETLKTAPEILEHIAFFENLLLNCDCVALKVAVQIMKHNLDYVKNLRLIAC